MKPSCSGLVPVPPGNSILAQMEWIEQIFLRLPPVKNKKYSRQISIQEVPYLSCPERLSIELCRDIFKWPYQANVIKMLETARRRIVRTKKSLLNAWGWTLEHLNRFRLSTRETRMVLLKEQ